MSLSPKKTRAERNQRRGFHLKRSTVGFHAPEHAFHLPEGFIDEAAGLTPGCRFPDDARNFCLILGEESAEIITANSRFAGG